MEKKNYLIENNIIKYEDNWIDDKLEEKNKIIKIIN